MHSLISFCHTADPIQTTTDQISEWDAHYNYARPHWLMANHACAAQNSSLNIVGNAKHQLASSSIHACMSMTPRLARVACLRMRSATWTLHACMHAVCLSQAWLPLQLFAWKAHSICRATHIVTLDRAYLNKMKMELPCRHGRERSPLNPAQTPQLIYVRAVMMQIYRCRIASNRYRTNDLYIRVCNSYYIHITLTTGCY